MTDKGYSRRGPCPGVAPPRWIVDEMLGRLARYLRFVGCDTLYLRGATDDEILARARTEGRVVLTRDRELARRAPAALRIESPYLRFQWAAVRAAWPDLPAELRFERCTVCNGTLAPYEVGTDPEREAGLPRERVAGGLDVWACAACGHLYWEGSHTARIRAQLAAWSREATP
jgi:uncharacterized protein with PIN domain